MPGTSRARRKLMPYSYRRFGIDCEIRNYELDGETRDGPIERQRQLVDATRQTEWETIRLNLELQISADVVEAVFPEAEHDEPPAALVVVTRCGDTYLRKGKTVATGPLVGGHTAGVTLSRDHLRNRATLTPYLVRTTDGRTTDGYAQQIGNRLASSRSWEIAIDRDESPNGGHLDVVFESFTEWDNNAVRRGQVYHLVADAGPEPTLYLNSDHQDIRPVLENEGSRGTPARIRDVAFDIIGNSVWTELFVSAAAEVNEDGDAVYDWQTAVLDRLLPMMYPESDMEAALSAVRAGVQDGENPSHVFNRLNAVLQTEVHNRNLQDHLTKLIQEVR